MRLVYAQQFRIAAPSGIIGSSVPEMLKKDVGAWICDWYSYWKSTELSMPETSQPVVPLPLHNVEAVYNTAPSSGAVHYAVTWRYPADEDDRLLWESRCEWASTGGDTEFSFLLRITSREFIIAPPQFTVRRPRIIRSIVKKFNCFSGGYALSALPQRVRIEDLSSFLEALQSKDRRLPIVLFSIDSYTERPLADPNVAQDKLVGLAHIYMLADKWTSFALTDKLGKSHSCFGGAIRIYWPGFDVSSNPYDHPMLMPNRIEALNADGRLVSDLLLRQFAQASTIRFAYGPVTKGAIAEVQAHRQAEIDALRKEAQSGGDYSDLLRLAEEEIAEHKKRIVELTLRLEDVENELSTAKDNITSLSIFRGVESESPLPATQAEPEVNTVREAVDLAAKRFIDTLIFLKSAFDAADESPYGQPNKVLQALEALDDVCKARRESIQRKQSIGLMEDVFISRGFTYKPKCSMTSIGKWAEEYMATYDGTRVSIEPHLALGKGGPDTCLRIHFYMDDKKGRFVVAHVGRHKTNTKT